MASWMDEEKTPVGSFRTILIVAALALASASPSLGGVADSPLPVLTSGGKAASRIFTVPGVMKVSNLEAEFTCTSLSLVPFKFAVEIFAPTGGPPLNNVAAGTGNGSATLAPGGTQTITTGSTVGLHEDVFISGLGTIVRNGSARIVSESKAITCTAYEADRFGTKRCTADGSVCTSDASCGGAAGSCRTIPDALYPLTVISGLKQKGD